MLEFDNGRHAAKSRHSLDQDFLPLAVKFGRKDVLGDLMKPFPAEPMRMWPISARVNKPENDDPSIVEPIELIKTAV